LNTTRLVFDYLTHFLYAGNEHSVHSPFLFNCYTKAIRTAKKNTFQPDIELLRKKLRNDPSPIRTIDYGAGSRKHQPATISTVAKNSLKPKSQAQLLYQLVRFTKAQHILELGTSLGLTTAYLARGNEQSQVVSLEGNPDLANLAKNHLNQLGCNRVEVICGSFETQLEIALTKLPRIDLAFFDGNHRYTPTLNYFEQCLSKKHNDSLFIFDDIYWSNEMKKAWSTLRQHKDVTVSVDLFHLGLLFFRQEQKKQHFRLRY
jgi:predicted O-methyltransferase YrrM